MQYFRAGNAADKFVEIDMYVAEHLRRLLLKRVGSQIRAGRGEAWRRPFFEALGSRVCAARFGPRWRTTA